MSRQSQKSSSSTSWGESKSSETSAHYVKQDIEEGVDDVDIVVWVLEEGADKSRLWCWTRSGWWWWHSCWPRGQLLSQLITVTMMLNKTLDGGVFSCEAWSYWCWRRSCWWWPCCWSRSEGQAIVENSGKRGFFKWFMAGEFFKWSLRPLEVILSLKYSLEGFSPGCGMQMKDWWFLTFDLGQNTHIFHWSFWPNVVQMTNSLRPFETCPGQKWGFKLLLKFVMNTGH